MFFCGFGEPEFCRKFLQCLQSTHYSARQKRLIQNRYLVLIKNFERDHLIYKMLYIFLSNFVSIAAVLVTALISLDDTSYVNDAWHKTIFWITWGLSILLLIANKLVYAFEIPKQMIILRVTKEKLKSEGYSFITNINAYSCDDRAERFAKFCAMVEQIKMNSVESLIETTTQKNILAMGSQPDNSEDDITNDEIAHQEIGIIQ